MERGLWSLPIFVINMKVKILLIAVFVPLFVAAQETCKVLLPALDSVYVGACKKGQADGFGEAWGKFYYKGKFVNGYPQGEGRAEYRDGTVYTGSWKSGLRNGKGTLTYQENGRVLEKTWIWKNDVKQKEVFPQAYRIISQRNIGRLRVYNQGGANGVWFQPNSDGGVTTDFQDFSVSGNSGREMIQRPKIGYEEVTFPFKGSVRFKAWNKLRTAQYELYLEIEITQPGNWVVEIQN